MSVERTLTAAGTRLAFCAACDVELPPRAERCLRCGAAAMTIRTGVDGNLGRVLDDRYEPRRRCSPSSRKKATVRNPIG